MDLFRKTEIVDEKIYEMFKELVKEYKGEIQLTSDSDFITGQINIRVKG